MLFQRLGMYQEKVNVALAWEACSGKVSAALDLVMPGKTKCCSSLVGVFGKSNCCSRLGTRLEKVSAVPASGVYSEKVSAVHALGCVQEKLIAAPALGCVWNH